MIGGGMLALVLLVAACAPAVAPATPAPAKPAPAALATPHAPGLEHADKPKGLEAIVELDLTEMSFDNPKREKNPVFRLPVGKTVGLHIHNQGAILHELFIGRGSVINETIEGKQVPAAYEENLFDRIEADLFIYTGVGADKIEIGGAKFGEIEVPAGVQNLWIRFKVPAELKGEWSLACFVPGHYEGGMTTKLVFE